MYVCWVYKQEQQNWCSDMKSIRRENGVSAIEFALVLPVAITIFYVIVSYSLAFVYSINLQSLASEIARAGVSVYTIQVPGQLADQHKSECLRGSTNANVRMECLADGIIGTSLIPADRIQGCSTGNSLYRFDDEVIEVCLQADQPLPPFRPFTMEGPLRASASVRLGSL